MNPRQLWLWGGALAVGVIGFLYFRKRAASGTSPGTAGRLGTPAAPAFSQQQEVQDFQVFSSLTAAQQASDLNFLSEIAGLLSGGSSPTSPGGTTPSSPPTTPSTPPATTPAPAPTPVPAPKSYGYGTVNTAQGQMVWLGVNEAGQPIYNVGGGAPVYFGNASALATGPQYEQSGEDIYTPVGYENLVSGSPSDLSSAYMRGVPNP